MARNKGGFVFASNFEVKLQGLLDPRGGVDNKADLINKETFPYDGDVIYMKEGMLVTVNSTQEVYMLVSLDNILAEDYSGWKRIDAGAAVSIDVIDSLESDSAEAALSAKQGKALKAEIDSVSAKLTGVYSYKGSKATFAELPTDANEGDVWNVEEAYDGHSAGTNWAWTGEEWDALAGSIDLSAYYNAEQVDAAIKVEADRAAAEEARLAGLIENNATAISTNAGDISKNTSDISTLSTQVSEFNSALAGKVDVAEGYQMISDEKLALIDTNAEDIDTLEGEISTLKGVDAGFEGRIETLEGMISGGEIDGSSLIEVVGNHTTQIAALETDNTTNKSDIAALKTADANFTTQINEIVTLNTQQTTQISDLSTELSTVKSSVSGNTTQIASLATTVGDHTTQISSLNSAIDGLAVKSVKEGDLILAADASGILSTTLSLGYDNENHKILLNGIDGAKVSELDASKFIKDGMIESVTFDSATNVITITWNTAAGIESTPIDISHLVDTYEAGNGLELSDNLFSVKIDTASSDALSVSASGLKLSVTDSLKEELTITSLTAAIEDHETRIDAIEAAISWQEIQ